MNTQRGAVVRLIVIAIVAVSIAGCGAKRLSYSPVFRFSIDEARAVVTRGFEDQHPAYRPTSVDVTNDKIDLVSRRVPTTLYFDDLGMTDLSYKKGYYIVRIFDRNGVARVHVFFRELPRAEHFADAIAVLERQFAE